MILILNAYGIKNACINNKYNGEITYNINLLFMICGISINSVLFSHSVVSNSFQPHGLQHTRLPCPSPTPGACSNSCPLVSDAIQSSHPLVIPFSFCLQSLPTSGSFSMSHFFASGGQSTGASASESVLPPNIQD